MKNGKHPTTSTADEKHGRGIDPTINVGNSSHLPESKYGPGSEHERMQKRKAAEAAALDTKDSAQPTSVKDRYSVLSLHFINTDDFIAKIKDSKNSTTKEIVSALVKEEANKLTSDKDYRKEYIEGLKDLDIERKLKEAKDDKDRASIELALRFTLKDLGIDVEVPAEPSSGKTFKR